MGPVVDILCRLTLLSWSWSWSSTVVGATMTLDTYLTSEYGPGGSCGGHVRCCEPGYGCGYGTSDCTCGGPLYLARYGLTGTLPAALGACASLEYVHLGRNALSGTLPAAWRGLTSVWYLHLGGNDDDDNVGLTGTLPPEWSDLTSLEHLFLHRNELTGSVPPSWGAPSRLRTLSLFSNALTGDVPLFFCDDPPSSACDLACDPDGHCGPDVNAFHCHACPTASSSLFPCDLAKSCVDTPLSAHPSYDNNTTNTTSNITNSSTSKNNTGNNPDDRNNATTSHATNGNFTDRDDGNARKDDGNSRPPEGWVVDMFLAGANVLGGVLILAICVGLCVNNNNNYKRHHPSSYSPNNTTIELRTNHEEAELS